MRKRPGRTRSWCVRRRVLATIRSARVWRVRPPARGRSMQARVREYEDALTKSDAAADRLGTAQSALETARTNAIASNDAIVKEAQQEAQNLLCGPSADAAAESTSDAPTGIDPECAGGLRAEAVQLRNRLPGPRTPQRSRTTGECSPACTRCDQLSSNDPLSGTAHYRDRAALHHHRAHAGDGEDSSRLPR